MPIFVAFYSFKGGVGRTAAAANVGWSLASRGQRVVLMDMDLEAPGLVKLPELAPPDDKPTSGIVEVAATYACTGRVPDLRDHAYPVAAPHSSGRLWVVPAGATGNTYVPTLARLDWHSLHPVLGSDPFVQELRAGVCSLDDPQYVLVDVGTGFSDVAGLTTHRLADTVVLVFNLTRGCIEGTELAYRSMTEREDPPHIVLVASPVPPAASEDSAAEGRIESARKLMPLGSRRRQPIVRVPYEPGLAQGDVLAVKEPSQFAVAATAYEQLRTLIQSASKDALLALEQARGLVSSGQVRGALAELRAQTEKDPDDAMARTALGTLLLAIGRTDEARVAFEEALAIGPSMLAARGLGEALVELDQGDEALESLRRAKELGDESPALYRAMARAAQKIGDLSLMREANRRSIGTSPEMLQDEDPEPAVAPPEPQRSGLQHPRRTSQQPVFDPEALWDSVTGSAAPDGAEETAPASAPAPTKAFEPLIRLIINASCKLDVDPEQARRQAEFASVSALSACTLAARAVLDRTPDRRRGVNANLMLPIAYDRRMGRVADTIGCLAEMPGYEPACRLWGTDAPDDCSRLLVVVAESLDAGYKGFWIPSWRHQERELPGAPRALREGAHAVFRNALPALEDLDPKLRVRWEAYMRDVFKEGMFLSLAVAQASSTGEESHAAVLNINVGGERPWLRAYHREWLGLVAAAVSPFTTIAVHAYGIALAATIALESASRTRLTLPIPEPLPPVLDLADRVRRWMDDRQVAALNADEDDRDDA